MDSTMKLRITTFKESGNQIRAQFGINSAPGLYGELTMPKRDWNLFAEGELSTGLAIRTIIVQGQVEAQQEGTRAAAG